MGWRKCRGSKGMKHGGVKKVGRGELPVQVPLADFPPVKRPLQFAQTGGERREDGFRTAEDLRRAILETSTCGNTEGVGRPVSLHLPYLSVSTGTDSKGGVSPPLSRVCRAGEAVDRCASIELYHLPSRGILMVCEGSTGSSRRVGCYPHSTPGQWHDRPCMQPAAKTRRERTFNQSRGRRSGLACRRCA